MTYSNNFAKEYNCADLAPSLFSRSSRKARPCEMETWRKRLPPARMSGGRTCLSVVVGAGAGSAVSFREVFFRSLRTLSTTFSLRDVSGGKETY